MSHMDAALVQVIAAIEEAFPDRVRGYYVHGSVADGTSVETSDVDLDIVVKGESDTRERAELGQAVQLLAAEREMELDVDVTDEASLLTGAEPTFKLGSRLIYGEDIRPQVPLLPVDQWGRERMYRGYFLMVRVFGRPSPIQYPIGFPDPDDEFFGYAGRRMYLADGTGVPSTRDMIRVAGWLATALIAHEGGRYVARKQDCHRLYRETIQDQWASVLEELYVTCRGRWHSLVPANPDERDHLRRICREILAFENHFLSRFKPFLLTELQRSQPEEECRAAWLMHEIPFDDADVRAAF